jgi:hypothetical protein
MVVHGFVIRKLSNEILVILSKIEKCVDEEEWEGAAKHCDTLEKVFIKKSFWLHMTINSEETRNMEISLYRIKLLAEKKQSENLYSEIALTKKIFEYLPKKEGFCLMEIL